MALDTAPSGAHLSYTTVTIKDLAPTEPVFASVFKLTHSVDPEHFWIATQP